MLTTEFVGLPSTSGLTNDEGDSEEEDLATETTSAVEDVASEPVGRDLALVRGKTWWQGHGQQYFTKERNGLRTVGGNALLASTGFVTPP